MVIFTQARGSNTRTHTRIHTRADHTKKHSVARYGNMHRTHTADKPAVSNNSGDPVLTCTVARWSSPPKTSLLPSRRSDSVALSLSALLPLSVSFQLSVSPRLSPVPRRRPCSRFCQFLHLLVLLLQQWRSNGGINTRPTQQ